MTTQNWNRLRLVAWAEGISYIVLLFIAMPMKYLADDPSAVRSVGAVHGALFVLFILVAIQAKVEQGWTARRLGLVILTTFVPFGMLLLDRANRERTPA